VRRGDAERVIGDVGHVFQGDGLAVAELQALVVRRAFIAMPDVGEVPGAFKGPEGAFNELQNLVVVVHGGHPILGAVAGLSSVVCGFSQARANHVTMASPHATPNG
jgi:hypothetical protein